MSLRESAYFMLLAMLGFISALARFLYDSLTRNRNDIREGEMREAEPQPFPEQHPLEDVHGSLVNRHPDLAARRVERRADVEPPPVQGSVELPRRYYAVARGRRPGIYISWDEVEPLVSGFRGNRFKSFRTRQEAEAYMLREGSRYNRP